MGIYILDKELYFPDVSQSSKEGIVAIGGDLSLDRLLLAYQSGIFPWYADDEPIVWWSPNPRFVLFPDELIISKSMRLMLQKQVFRVTYNQAFYDVIKACALAKRNYQDEAEYKTWINDDMIDAYLALYKNGNALSVEVWQDDLLVGGLYGVVMGKCFFGESMFHVVSNASKYGFISLVNQLKSEQFKIIDCQVHTKHLESLGARMISRNEFIHLLKNNI